MIMKNTYLFMMFFMLVIVSCGDKDENVEYPPATDNVMSISLHGIWSDDLLEFVTPKLVYTDAKGNHQKIITDEKRKDEVWEMDGEVYDFNIQSWEDSIKYAFSKGNVASLKIVYEPNENVSIDEDAVYSLEHNLNVTEVMMNYVRDNGEIVVYFATFMGGQKADEIKCTGRDIPHVIDSLLAHPLERKIFIRDKEVVIE